MDNSSGINSSSVDGPSASGGLAGAPAPTSAADLEDNASLIQCAADELGDLGLPRSGAFLSVAPFIKRYHAIPYRGDTREDAEALLKQVEGFSTLHSRAWALRRLAAAPGPIGSAAGPATEGGFQTPRSGPADPRDFSRAPSSTLMASAVRKRPRPARPTPRVLPPRPFQVRARRATMTIWPNRVRASWRAPSRVRCPRGCCGRRRNRAGVLLACAGAGRIGLPFVPPRRGAARQDHGGHPGR